MDYRYDTKNEVRDFHKQRVAFIIINNDIIFIKNSDMSHWEYCQTLNITKEVFNTLIRGYFINDEVVFYKNNFIYDDDVIEIGLKYISKIKKESNATKLKIYFGLIIDTSKKIWPYDYYYGKINEENYIVKEHNNS